MPENNDHSRRKKRKFITPSPEAAQAVFLRMQEIEYEIMGQKKTLPCEAVIFDKKIEFHFDFCLRMKATGILFVAILN